MSHSEIHFNSLLAYMDERVKLSKRCTEILEHLQCCSAKTDRQVAGEMLYPDMNCVRPRITELIKGGFLEEVGKTKCSITNKSVRLVKFKIPTYKETDE
jgi:hypothetical protein